MNVLASIPSPGSGTLDLGPFTIHMYGLTLLAAIALCIYVTGRRWVARGGDWDLIFRCAVWGVAAGIVGARLYHLAHELGRGAGRVVGPVRDLEGRARRLGRHRRRAASSAASSRSAPARTSWLLADCLAPGLLLAQGVGRLGNWWNQELFGKPTDLPWGLEIDPANRPLSSLEQATFHPTFLYEMLWDFPAPHCSCS